MERAIETVKGTGKVLLALAGCVLMPMLIWTAFGVAMNRKLRQREAQLESTPAVYKIPAKNPVLAQGEN